MQITLNKIANYLIVMLLFFNPCSFLPDLSVVLIDLIFIYFVIKEKNLIILIILFLNITVFNLYISLRSLFANILLSIKSSLAYEVYILIFAVNFFNTKKIFSFLVFYLQLQFYL